MIKTKTVKNLNFQAAKVVFLFKGSNQSSFKYWKNSLKMSENL